MQPGYKSIGYICPNIHIYTVYIYIILYRSITCLFAIAFSQTLSFFRRRIHLSKNEAPLGWHMPHPNPFVQPGTGDGREHGWEKNIQLPKNSKCKPRNDILGTTHTSKRKAQEWASMKNKQQSKERAATKRGATKQNRKKTRAREKRVGHKCLPALQKNYPSQEGQSCKQCFCPPCLCPH